VRTRGLSDRSACRRNEHACVGDRDRATTAALGPGLTARARRVIPTPFGSCPGTRLSPRRKRTPSARESVGASAARQASLRFERNAPGFRILRVLGGNMTVLDLQRPIQGRSGASHERLPAGVRPEYGVASNIEPTPYEVVRWFGDATQPLPSLGGQTTIATDRQHRRVLLFGSAWELQ
jgi:hypothetical protein